MSRLVLIVLGMVLVSVPAEAQPTAQQRAACEQDAYRLCQDLMPDEAKVRNCLRRNLRRLSPVCRAAFTRRRR